MTQSPQTVDAIEKRQYKNNTSGWLGVVTLDHQGKEVGISMAPLGTVWLSDAEAILTARAPADPANNPFEEQSFMGLLDGVTTQIKMRPLTLAEGDSRFVPTNERYVPGITDEATGRANAEAAARADEPGAITAAAAAASHAITDSQPTLDTAPEPMPVDSPPAPTPAEPTGPPPVPAAPTTTPGPAMQATPAVGLAGENPTGTDEPSSWVGEPDAPGEVLAGSLGGENAPAGQAEEAPAGAAAAIPAQSVPTAPGGAPAAEIPAEVAADIGQAPAAAAPALEGTPDEAPQGAGEALSQGEETAAAVDPAVGEETGAAQPPAGPPSEGEFAQAEEVGSPDAPTQTGS